MSRSQRLRVFEFDVHSYAQDDPQKRVTVERVTEWAVIRLLARRRIMDKATADGRVVYDLRPCHG